MTRFATIIVEKQSNGTWLARFARVRHFSGNGDWPVTALNQLIECFGWDNVKPHGFAEITAGSREAYRMFQIPLNDRGVNRLRRATGLM